MLKAWRYFSTLPISSLSGLVVWLFIVSFYGLVLSGIFTVETDYKWTELIRDDYIKQVILFSFGQAILSSLLSVFFGLLFARAFFYQRFIAKSLILKLFSLTFVLPALVVIFGITGVYGHNGWLVKLTTFLGITWQPHIYGLSGILIAHLFFNIPLAARMFLQTFQTIPTQQRQLASQLNLRGWQFIRLIEFPYLRQQLLPVFGLIFMLCFTSFSIVLTLGGGPKYTTLEVAIYQAVLFEFDLAKSALFALLQVIFCCVLFALGSLWQKSPQVLLHSKNIWLEKQSRAVQIWQIFYINCVLLFISLPLINIVFSAFQAQSLWQIWQQSQLWQALGYSLAIAPLSAILAMLFSVSLLLLARRLHYLSYSFLSQSILNSGMLVLAVPVLVISVGLFIRLREMDFSHYHLFALVVLCNGLTAMPFVLQVLKLPMYNNMQHYEKLSQSLAIQGWNRFYLIEWHNLKASFKYAFALACAISLGDFTAIALFGNQDFSSLPYLLYQQLGSYRSDEGAVTALVLLVFCTCIFILIERIKKDD
ncbi:thiamine/thiamine pyrophosphate ABC transporter permease ThiP [Histophilus somni]|uniref:thiamine/thiamine pyrophosphate ABC transporter permease ThiP n=1 Tax=Histophilus somni TaxID=731 RepID=UPI00109C34E1|nr:thiamine/thiamine pyrophosphate ABC transporter permease ThiP [Histophilus somni]QEH18045.1 thiamine/thiamine pyrophosphate ABC transporter permease ThiP [Histophilus somni]THA22508.1 thiamine/thiamine pyrophosphate ABC transporter permease ThiP [Histophilus somni]